MKNLCTPNQLELPSARNSTYPFPLITCFERPVCGTPNVEPDNTCPASLYVPTSGTTLVATGFPRSYISESPSFVKMGRIASGVMSGNHVYELSGA